MYFLLQPDHVLADQVRIKLIYLSDYLGASRLDSQVVEIGRREKVAIWHILIDTEKYARDITPLFERHIQSKPSIIPDS